MTRDRFPDLHHLYECAVQSVDADLDFAERVYRNRHRRAPRVLKEDFCGTAALACSFLLRHPENRAVAVDLDERTLAWGRRHNVAALGEAAGRLELLRDDVRRVLRPRCDLTLALNFSYWVFKTREELLLYFRAAREGLSSGGLLVLDLFGGSEAMLESLERRRVAPDVCFDGTRVPAFTYLWEQALFNPVTHDFLCYIHFEFRGRRRRRAFRYDWRFWTLPELRELLAEAGFSRSDVYVDSWDEESEESDGVYRRRTRFDNEGVWVGYLVAER